MVLEVLAQEVQVSEVPVANLLWKKSQLSQVMVPMVPINLDNYQQDLMVLVTILIQAIILINGRPGERLMDSFVEILTIAIG